MNKLNLAVLVSGEGTNLQSIIDSIKLGILECKISVIVSNKMCNAISRANDNNICTITFDWDKKKYSREEYDLELVNRMKQYNVDLVVLAGWMHIFTNNFLKNYNNIINLHPALSNTFVGDNCMINAFNAFNKNKINYSGIMVHRVTNDLDRGPMLNEIKVPIYRDDNFEDFKNRMKRHEKGLLIKTIQEFIIEYNDNKVKDTSYPVYQGKVRKVSDVGYGVLLLETTNRLSAFDKNRCEINNKGIALNLMSKWWLLNTRDIIPNHYLWSKGKYMIVKKTRPIRLEVVVRGYLTGSSKTSIWKMYSQGKRQMYGITFPDGLKQHQKLDHPIITPTTKGETDDPLTPDDIVDRKILTRSEWNFISEKALAIYNRGVEYAKRMGLILVDTKYEFGYDSDGSIILIDEVHTCDSSRYWVIPEDGYSIDNYKPIKLDKDAVRDWLLANCENVYTDNIPIPREIRQRVEDTYLDIVRRLYTLNIGLGEKDLIRDMKTENVNMFAMMVKYFNFYHNRVVYIVAGSTKDRKHVEKIQKFLEEFSIYSTVMYSSAHKNTQHVIDHIKLNDRHDRKMVWVTVAGRSNALSGVVASNSKYPVIASPPFSDKQDMMVNINSTLQCPSNVPVMTILEPCNVALAINKIFSM